MVIAHVTAEGPSPMSDPRLVPPHDFGAGSNILNLAASLAERFGARPAARPLRNAAVRQALEAHRATVFVLFDGLGERPLAMHAPHGALSQCRVATLDSVFPSSTAPAMTSLAAAAPPAVHGNPGWLMWSDAAGAIIRTLPMDLRADHSEPAFAEGTWSWQPWATRSGARLFALLPRHIACSEYSRYSYAGSTVIAYRSIDDVTALVLEALGACDEDTMVFVYLPHFDTVSHERGCESDAASRVVGRLDRWFVELLERLACHDVLLLASADHGFIDVAAEDQLRLEDFPEIAACLGRPLCGEPRVPFCYVRDERRERFGEIVRGATGDAFDVYESGALLDAGWFGALPAAGRTALSGRIGTHVLVPRRRVTLVDELEGEKPTDFIGMHGGIDADEMRVPLVAAQRGARVG